MKVLKFGGTSVGSVNSILSVKKIVEAIEEPVIVVVSALGGITDKLLATSTMASKGDLAYEKELSEIIARHLDVIEGVIEDKEVRMDVQKKVMALLDELSNIFKGVYLINDLSAKTSDTIVSYGERLSSLIVSNVIKDAKLFDSRKYIKTVKQFNKHIVDFDLTNKLIKETFSPLPKVSLVPGFISSSTETGEVTNLGRGGSDYTASILATALDANTLEIWTDVDGFMTADPRVISSAYVIDRLTFTEAMELCNFGAKVIYPPTIYPVYHKNIPIRILNTFNPTAPGTYISKERVKEEGKAIIKGISSINDTCLITVQGLGMVGVIGVNYRIFKTLAKNGISVFMVSQASSENNTTFAVRNADADLAVQVLNDEFALERAQGDMNDTVAEKDLATVAIVGENMKRTPGTTADHRLFGTADGRQISGVRPDQFGGYPDRRDGKHRQRNRRIYQSVQPVPGRQTERRKPPVRTRENRTDLGIGRRTADRRGGRDHHLRRRQAAFRTGRDRKTGYRYRIGSRGRSGQLPARPVQHPHGPPIRFDRAGGRGPALAIGHLFVDRPGRRPVAAVRNPHRLDRQRAGADLRRHYRLDGLFDPA